MLSKFNLYDFIAGVIPGIFFLWSLGTVLEVDALRQALPLTGGLAETSVLIVVGYITGLLLQGVSQLITENLLFSIWGGFPSARYLLHENQRFTELYKTDLNRAVSERFGVSLETAPSTDPLATRLKRSQEIFYRCYRAVDKLSDLPQTFNAQYGLFRALLTTFTLLGLIAWALVGVEWHALGTPDRVRVIFALTITVAAVLSYFRMIKRADDFAKAVFDVFLV